MKTFAKILAYTTYTLLILNSIIFLGTVIELARGWIGFLGYALGIIIAPLFSPAMIALPWFESWVSGEPVNERLLMIWGAFILCIILRIVTWKWVPDK